MNIEEAYLQQYSMELIEDPNLFAERMTGGTEPAGAEPMTLGEFGMGVADTAAGLAKGAIQGSIGLPGDVESLVYGFREMLRRGADENALDAFISGLEQGTVLPTTEDVKRFLDETVGPLVPAGASEKRREAAKTPEFVGELGGAGKTIKEVAKAAGRAAKAITSTPPRGSIKLAPDLEVEIAPAERTKNFKNWFSDSKVVDDKGKPLIVYHGTQRAPKGIEKFKGNISFFSENPEYANRWADIQIIQPDGSKFPEQAQVMPVYLSIKKPYNGDVGDIWLEEDLYDSKIVEKLKAQGYDGAFWTEQMDGKFYKNWVSFYPENIKSAIGNKGTFDPNDPRITRGAVAAPAAPAAMQDEEQK